MPTPEEIIETNLSKPQSVEADGTKVQQHSLPDQIAAAEFLASKQAPTTRHKGIRWVRFIHPGSV